MANVLFLASSSFPYTAVLAAAVILTAPVVFALPSLTFEQQRRTPVLAIMAAFSPLAITGFSLLAIVTSYALLRLFYFLKPRFLSSATRVALPQPVSASRSSALSVFSPFSFLRSRQKSTTTTNKPVPTRSRWSPLSSFLRRLTRPPFPLHLSGAEVLPTTMPDSPSATHSLLDLPVMSVSSPVPAARNHCQRFQETRQLSRSSSMDALPSYKPLTPVPVLVPAPMHSSLPPATPPPPSPTSLPGITDADIPLVPITPPRHRYAPADMTSPSSLPTPPLTGAFPAISLSPFKPSGSSTAIPSNAGQRPSSPSPNLFLTSRTLSSLSLSPRSLYLQQSRRSKSLGGAAVKKITPPHTDLDEEELELERTQDVADCSASTGNAKVPTFIMPMFEMRDQAKEETTGKTTELVPSAASFAKFHLNFSSSSSSSTSDSSRSSNLLSPSPLTSNSESAPTSVPAAASRTTSQSSYSSDIAKPSEAKPLLPRPIPLVDIDMNVDADMMHGYGFNERMNGWSFDVDEPVDVERVFVDFDVPIPAYTKDPGLGLGTDGGEKVEERLVRLDDEAGKADVEQVRENKWEWDDDPEDQGRWNVDPHTEDVVTPPVPPPTLTLVKESDVDDGIEYPDPELLPLPETIDILPLLVTKPMDVPVISICTQAVVLHRNESECDSDIVSTSSLGRATPVSLGQTPTPPASPPREVRFTSLPRAGNGLNGSSLNGSAVPSPVAESSISVDVETKVDIPVSFASPLVYYDEESQPLPTRDEGCLLTEQSNEEEEEVIPRIFDDEPLVSSPECIMKGLDESDDEVEYTFSFEEDAEEGRMSGSDDDIEVGVDIVPPSPYDRAVGWDSEPDDEEEASRPEYVTEGLPSPPSGKVESHEHGPGEGEVVNDAVEEERVHDEVAQVSTNLEVAVESETPARSVEDASPPVGETIRGEAPSTSILAPAPEPTTSLPGTFPDVTSLLKTETETEPQFPSPPVQPRRRIRSPLEEAIARTRSPLEVALAMQLRPGLGPGADPAWMVRFLMVMWGWMFGLVLVPTTEH